jgi:protoheme IX farnesyltransferase
MLTGTSVRPTLANKSTASVWRPHSINTTAALPAVYKEYLKLTKPRITTLIIVSTAVGFYFGRGSTPDLTVFFHAMLGTALMAAGSATLNQLYERDVDKKMQRTRHRPLVTGTLSPRQALYFGLLLSFLGFAELAVFTNVLAGCLGLATLGGYLFFYTPLKQISPVCTTIGAIPGAIPPLIGFAAASGHLTYKAWILFGILFLWQFPHFYAISWMYKEDYARAGIKMLAVVRPNGSALTIRILTALLLLIPVSAAPTFMSMTGRLYLFGSVLLGFAFLYFGVQVARDRTYSRARKLLWASVSYLPLLFGLLILDRP